ncbi:phage regulatory CII family protein [Novosphingopyxis sp. YJ-S2-01]|uniref:phage regulatory CII family protein n=1 Tax=Novosphingopyxis sp. YJ-S2-01 TaxID=2794021 RepID=UPI0018DE33E7|nr:phage regulatory CII family protein [Novosphingopyxis sp. YJ-S2-01]MBH9537921.1 hypothetical protein [Novosphingopyxis sp. YJ-S2-01]
MRELEGSLPAEEQRQARAVRQAIEAAGGFTPCAQDTGKSESLLSRAASPNYHHSLTIRDVEIIESAGHGKAGHPHITRHLCRANGGLFVPLPDAAGGEEALLKGVTAIAAEFGDVSRAVSEGLADDDFCAADARRALIELDEVDVASASLRLVLKGIAEGSA